MADQAPPTYELLFGKEDTDRDTQRDLSSHITAEAATSVSSQTAPRACAQAGPQEVGDGMHRPRHVVLTAGLTRPHVTRRRRRVCAAGESRVRDEDERCGSGRPGKKSMLKQILLSWIRGDLMHRPLGSSAS